MLGKFGPRGAQNGSTRWRKCGWILVPAVPLRNNGRGANGGNWVPGGVMPSGTGKGTWGKFGPRGAHEEGHMLGKFGPRGAHEEGHMRRGIPLFRVASRCLG